MKLNLALQPAILKAQTRLTPFFSFGKLPPNNGVCLMEAYYWGLSNDEWRTISIVLQGLLMVILTGIGIIQLIALSRTARETKRSRTLAICDQFHTDPIMHDCKRQLFIARKNGDLVQNPLKYRMEIMRLLNFFEALAIGIKRRIYDEDLAYDYLEAVFRTYVKIYLIGNIAKQAELVPDSKSYENLLVLFHKWNDSLSAASIHGHALEIIDKPVKAISTS